MITKFGKELRKYRIDQNMTLRDMAAAIDVSAAYLSAVESGKKNITDSLVASIINLLNLDFLESERLQKCAALSRKEVSINLSDADESQKNSAVMFARRLHQLSEDDLEQINKILEG